MNALWASAAALAALLIDRGPFEPPPGGHLQGVTCHQVEEAAGTESGYECLISGSSDSAGYVVRSSGGRLTHLQLLPGADFDHAGGLQWSDDVVAVGVEDSRGKRHSEVQLWDWSGSEPRPLPHLTIARGGADAAPRAWTAGAVGLARHGAHHWLVVGNWDSDDLDFHRSNGLPLTDPEARFEPAGRWESGRADRKGWRPNDRWRDYQALQLFSRDPDTLLLVGLADRVADIFRLRPGQSLELVKIQELAVPLVDTSFRWGGGVTRSADGQWLFFATEKRLGKNTRLEIVRVPRLKN
ncbi:MAG: hypothetical protein O7G30_02395 [Proteobacteria bacterium]|nr:hypothetical protein [Pseudomonadota bacterium]